MSEVQSNGSARAGAYRVLARKYRPADFSQLIGQEPMVRTLTNAFVEAELGWLGQTDETDWSRLAHGVHAGVAVGGRALRARFFFPGVALGLSYERTFRNDDADLSSLKVGARVTFDLDL